MCFVVNGVNRLSFFLKAKHIYIRKELRSDIYELVCYKNKTSYNTIKKYSTEVVDV